MVCLFCKRAFFLYLLFCLCYILFTLPSLNTKHASAKATSITKNATRDEDYSLVEDESDHEDDTNKTNENSKNGEPSYPAKQQDIPQKQTQPPKNAHSQHASDNTAGIITNMSDIVKLVRFVFLRGHIVLDASHKVIVKNESRIEQLLDYIHDIQLRNGKHRVLPMDDRDLGCEDMEDSKLHLKELCNAATFDCLSASEMMQMLPPPTSLTFHQAITRICPLLLFRQSRPICIADVKKLLDAHLNQKIKLVEPSIERVWGFGLLFVTISIVVSMGGLMLLPLLKKSSRTTLLTFFEGLAVGGLAGSAILHLFPQAFDIVDDKYRAYFWNTFFIFAGIYIFYCIEMCLKIFKTYYSRNRRKRVPSLVVFREDSVLAERMRRSPSPASSINFLSNCKGGSVYQIKYATSSEDSSSSSDDDHEEYLRRGNVPGEIIALQTMQQHIGSKDGEECDEEEEMDPDATVSSKGLPLGVVNSVTGNKEALITSTREQLAQCLSTVNVVAPAPPSNYSLMIQRKNPPAKPITRPIKERMVPNVALRRQDHETSHILVIDTLAWMIVLGDALLNFIDGLSIGAAFDRNILAGMSISVAVMLEEVTHRLGTFAVLIRAGMSMKQSFFYIFLSACACYPGLALGIFLGDEAEDASPYIFALAGGFFLYMALVDVMKAMTRTMEYASRKNIRTLLHIWALQNVGIVLAAISLALLAFYEKEMDFERREIAEIKGNSFI